MSSVVSPLPGGIAGTMSVLQTMARLARESYPLIQGIQPESADGWIRQHLNYQHELFSDVQVLRNPMLMWREYQNEGRITGACADVAVLLAVMIRAHSFGSRNNHRRTRLSGNTSWLQTAAYAMNFCAARPATSNGFTHVFLTVDGERLDPAAPSDANYSDWQLLCLPI